MTAVPGMRWWRAATTAFLAAASLASPAVGAVGSWTSVTLPGTPGPVLAIGVPSGQPSVIYAGTRDGGVLKSVNGGASFAPANAGLPESGAPPLPPVVQSLAIRPGSPSTVFAGTVEDGVFMTTNGGGTWTSASTGLGNPDVRAIAINPANPDVMYAATAGGVYSSANGGGSWAPASTGITHPDAWALAISRQNPSIVFAGTFPPTDAVDPRGLFRSADAGASWAPTGAAPLAPTGTEILAIRPASGSSPEKLYASTFSSFAVSRDAGATFASPMAHPLSFPTALVPDEHSPTRLFAASEGGGAFLVDEATDGTDLAFLSRTFTAGLLDLNTLALVLDQPSGTLVAGAAGGIVSTYRLPIADLAVSVAATSRAPYVTTVEVRNLGGETAPGAHLITGWLANRSVTYATTRGSCTSSMRGADCDLGDMPPGATATVTVTTPTLPFAASGQPTVVSIARDPNPGNDSAPLPLLFPAPPPPVPPAASVTRTPKSSLPAVSKLSASCRRAKKARPTAQCVGRVRFRLSRAARVRVMVVRLSTRGRVGAFVVKARAGLNNVKIPRTIVARAGSGRFLAVVRPVAGNAKTTRARFVIAKRVLPKTRRTAR